MFKTALIYGSISGAVIIAAILIGLKFGDEHGTGVFSSEWFGYSLMIVALSTIFLAIRDYRNKTLGGVIKFFPALGMGVLIALIAGIAYVAGWELYLYATHYAFMDNYVAALSERLRASGQTGPALQAKLAELEQMRVSYQNPLFRFAMTFIEIFPVGLLIAIISAAILRNPKVLPARA